MTDYSVFTAIIRERVSAQELGADFGLKVGRDGRCRCVFCDGARSDTLRLYPGSRGYYCFRCHEQGDVIKFYQKLTGCNFPKAVEGLNEEFGIGLPLDGSDKDAIKRAREESERRKKAREAETKRQERLQEELWDAEEAVSILEYHKAHNAPQGPSEPWKQRFILALRYLDEMKDYRDRLFDEVYRKKPF